MTDQGTEIEGDIGFEGRAGDIVGLVIKNALLNIITLGFYRFWARTHVRRYLWEKMHLSGSPLEYTGTGKELFVGFMMIVLVVFVPYAILNAVMETTGLAEDEAVAGWYGMVTFLAFLYLIGVARYRARRYRLTRTRWRGIRAGQTGSSWVYGLWSLLFSLLMVFFGLITPYRNMKLWRFRIKNTQIGDRFFVFDPSGEAGRAVLKLYPAFLLVYLVPFVVFFVPTMIFVTMSAAGLVEGSLSNVDIQEITQGELDNNAGYAAMILVLWIVGTISFALTLIRYKMKETQTLVGLTTFESLKLRFEAKTFTFFKLYATNGLIILLTLGFGLPFTQVRLARFVARHTKIEGRLDLASISQIADDELTRGEGLAEAFDMGAV